MDFKGTVLPMQRRHQWTLQRVALSGALCLALLFPEAIKPAFGAEGNLVASYGSGAYRLIVFSDYFCQPCQKMEKTVAGPMQDLIEGGGVKVSFVDVPIYKLTPLYARYFLYAAKAAESPREVLLARDALFDTASRIGAVTEPQLQDTLKSRNISLKPYDVTPVLAQYNELVKKYRVNGTPTFVFVYSPADIRKYSEREKIMTGLAELRKVLGRP